MTEAAPRLDWTADGLKLLLKWLDDNKGPNGRLRQGDGTVVDDFLKSCREPVPVNHTFTGDVPVKKVQDKIRRIWEECRLAKYKAKEFKDYTLTFYNEGSAGLDWNSAALLKKLEGCYTQEELEARRSDNTTASKRSLQDEEASHGDLEPQQTSKRQRLTKSNDDQAVAASKSADFAIDVESLEPVPGPEPVRGEGPATTHQAKEPRESGPVDSTQTQAVQDPVHVSTTTHDSTRNMPKLQKLLEELRDVVESDGLTKESHIMTCMDTIKDEAWSAVDPYLKHSELADKQSVIIESAHAHPHELNTLLGLALGGRPTSRDDRRRRFEALQEVENIGYSNFLHSLVAAAVFNWCFEAMPKQDEVFEDIGAIAIGKALEISECL